MTAPNSFNDLLKIFAATKMQECRETMVDLLKFMEHYPQDTQMMHTAILAIAELFKEERGEQITDECQYVAKIIATEMCAPK